MSNSIKISHTEARKLAISGQGLSGNENNSLKIIQQLGYVQIDTISVTERAHHHVLFTRNPTYHQKELSELMAAKSIFEYWSHAAAYLPIADYRFSLHKKELYKDGDKHWFPRDKKVEKYVIDRIKAEGALQSKDFENPSTKNNQWYEWKPAKIALTNLFMDGSLMIANRKGFQKIFDLPERVLPPDLNLSIPTAEEYHQHILFNAIKAHGLVNLNEIIYLRKGIKQEVKKLLNKMVESSQITTATITGINETYYTNNQLISSINNTQNDSNKRIHILNPFDNLLIQRKRVKEIFNFDYQIECYVPEKKRKFGYYVLPVLYGDEFVARIDAKADRKEKIFYVNNTWLEPQFKPTSKFINEFSNKINEYAKFCGCQSIKINKLSFFAKSKD